jgi:uncharacterized protein (TIGR03503 family)
MPDSRYDFTRHTVQSRATAKLFALGLLLCLFCVIVPPVSAQAPEAKKPSDVRMVIDISGSMKKNDPQNLRRPALEMLVQLLPNNSKAGIWSFGQYVNMLVPHGVVDKKWGNKAIQSSSGIKSIAQFTNIGEALEKAAYDFKSTDNRYQRHVILLTDGMVDIDRDAQVNNKERQRIINTILPMYKQAGITLHTIALSDNADKQLLNKFSLMTDGKAAVAKTAEELMSVFLAVFDQAVPSEGLPFDGEIFAVDSSIEEFTALIFRQPNAKETELYTPEGKKYTQSTKDKHVSWYHTDKYDLITISQPFEGEWKVSADVEPQSRITVVSDLSLAVRTMPTNISVNDTVSTSLALREENQTITRDEFLGLLDIDVMVSSSNGKEWSQRLSQGLVPKDGVYSTLLEQFDSEGQYTVNFTVDGKSFKRQFSHQLSVRKPFLVDVKKITTKGKNQFAVQVISQTKNIPSTTLRVAGSLQTPTGVNEILPFTLEDDGTWLLTIAAEQAGEYVLSVSVSDNSNGQHSVIETLRFNHGSNDAIFSVAPVEKPAPVAQFLKQEEPVLDAPEESVVENKVAKDDGNMMQLALYGIIGAVNLLIIGLAYLLYRKLFKKKVVEEEPEDEEENTGFVEPPMDEMAVEDIEEDEPEPEEALDDLPDEDSDSSTVDDDDTQDLNLDEDEEDIPDFSLDDFSPESIEDDENVDDSEKSAKT